MGVVGVPLALGSTKKKVSLLYNSLDKKLHVQRSAVYILCIQAVQRHDPLIDLKDRFAVFRFSLRCVRAQNIYRLWRDLLQSMCADTTARFHDVDLYLAYYTV